MSTEQQQPAFRKWTPAVERGIRYALAALDFDAAHRLDALAADGATSIPGLVVPDDMRAAAQWLRAQVGKRSDGE